MHVGAFAGAVRGRDCAVVEAPVEGVTRGGNMLGSDHIVNWIDCASHGAWKIRSELTHLVSGVGVVWVTVDCADTQAVKAMVMSRERNIVDRVQSRE
jgi:hypothetical protein